jgi:hypothetical protein
MPTWKAVMWYIVELILIRYVIIPLFERAHERRFIVAILVGAFLDYYIPSFSYGVVASGAYQELSRLSWIEQRHYATSYHYYIGAITFALRSKQFHRISNPTLSETQAFNRKEMAFEEVSKVAGERFERDPELWKELTRNRRATEQLFNFFCLQKKANHGLGKLPGDLLRMLGGFIIPKVSLYANERDDLDRWTNSMIMSPMCGAAYCKYFNAWHKKIQNYITKVYE